MSTNDLERLLPCPFCGGGMTQFQNNGQVWVGTKYGEPTSVSVRHWCEELPGPSRMIERIGRDKEQAIERWNMRAQTAPSVSDENEAFEAWFRSEQGKPYDGMWSFARAAWIARARLAPGAQENNDG